MKAKKLILESFVVSGEYVSKLAFVRICTVAPNLSAAQGQVSN